VPALRAFASGDGSGVSTLLGPPSQPSAAI
jgi:hypothetical protein